MNLLSRSANLQQTSLRFMETTQEVKSSAIDRSTRQGTGGLRDRPISVGSGENRGRAQSGQESSKGILASLSRGLNSVINGAVGLFKDIGAYLFESSKPDTLQRPKEQMRQFLKDTQNDVKTLWKDLTNSEPSNPIEDAGRWFNKNVARPINRRMEPEPSWAEKKLQRVEDFLSDRFSR